MNPTWAADNRRHAAAAFARVAALVENADRETVSARETELETVAAGMSNLSALSAIATAFGMSPFELDILTLCAGVELDDGVRDALAHAGVPAPTFRLALARLPHPHSSALTPAAALRHWHLVEPEPSPALTDARLGISERVLHYVAGVDYLDEVTGLRHADPAAELFPAHRATVRRAAAAIESAVAADRPVVQLVVRSRDVGEAIAAAVARELGLTAAILDARDIPSGADEVRTRSRLIEREAVLAGLVPVVDAADSGEAAVRLADELTGPAVVVTRHPLRLRHRDVVLEVPAVTTADRQELWTSALGGQARGIRTEVRRVADAFDLDPRAIRAAAGEFAAAAPVGAQHRPKMLWAAARARSRPRLDGLAQRVTRHATWDDLVLPADQVRTLHEIADQLRWRASVVQRWGIDGTEGEAAGITALFAGQSGTGKTMAASVLATDLELDLWRIDLSQVVSKYIGETEKNLATVFDEAEGSGAVLLFDEADALFGKRSEVKDSHDRYANLEVSFLLQRMESYTGLAVLTSNNARAIDDAFERRLRFVVPFPLPDLAGRAAIWRRMYPPKALRADVDVDLLAQLVVAGGNIRTIAVNAAYAAAADRGKVSMRHLLRAARSEFVKLDRSLPEAQVRGWT